MKIQRKEDLSSSEPLVDLSMRSTGTEPVRLFPPKSLKIITSK